MWGRKPKRELMVFSSFEELERNTLHLLDDYTDAELVAYFFAKRREWHMLRGNNPDEMVGERKILVKKTLARRRIRANQAGIKFLM